MDDSDRVASESLAHRAEHELVFTHRRWHEALAFGSFGSTISVPFTMLLASGELRLVLAPAALPVYAVYALGLVLLYFALRALVNRSRLEVDGSELRFRRAPLWPLREQRIPLAAIVGTIIELRPDSFFHPATWRGMPAVRPFVVSVRLEDGTDATLPLALGVRDASEVAAWIERAARESAADGAPLGA